MLTLNCVTYERCGLLKKFTIKGIGKNGLTGIYKSTTSQHLMAVFTLLLMKYTKENQVKIKLE